MMTSFNLFLCCTLSFILFVLVLLPSIKDQYYAFNMQTKHLTITQAHRLQSEFKPFHGVAIVVPLVVVLCFGELFRQALVYFGASGFPLLMSLTVYYLIVWVRLYILTRLFLIRSLAKRMTEI